MRRGTGIVAVGGIIGIAVSVAADEGLFPRSWTAPTRAPLQFFSRAKPSTGEPEEKSPPAGAKPDQNADSTQRVDSAEKVSDHPSSEKGASPSAQPRGIISTLPRSPKPAASGEADLQPTGLKNYHRELFGTAPPPVGHRAAPQDAAVPKELALPQHPAEVASSRRTVSSVPVRQIPLDFEGPPTAPKRGAELDASAPIEIRSSKTEPISEPGAANGERPPAEFAVQPAAPERFRRDRNPTTSPASEGGEVIQADHREAAGARRAGIVPVRGTEGAASPQETRAEVPPSNGTTSPRPFPAGGASERVAEGAGGADGSGARSSDPPHPFSVGAGDTGAASVSLEWVKRGEASVGRPGDFELVVRNVSDAPARDLVVDAYFPPSVRLTKAQPQPRESIDHLSWKFPVLGPRQESVIRLSLIPSRRGDLPLRAYVRFTSAAAAQFTVEEPLLKLAIAGPKDVTLGDAASQIVTVSNPGNGAAHEVVITAAIPNGLEHPQGKQLRLEIGSLSPGESRQVRLGLAAVEGGEQELVVEATAGNALRQEIAAPIRVIAPSLKISVTGPGLRYKGRTARYTVQVTNDGTASTSNVRLVHKVPEGFRFEAADKGGRFDAASSTVNWFVGKLDTGESAEFHADLQATGLGDFEHVVSAFSDRGAQASARLATRIDGAASLNLEIVDLDDPVEVGGECAYEVRLKNDGSKSAQNVGLSCELAPEMELLSAKGPAPHLAENGVVVFRSLPELAPGQTATFRVHVRGTVPGSHRFRCRLASDSTQEPLICEALTRFYRD